MSIIPRVIDLSHYDDVEDSFAGAVKSDYWGVINKVTEGYGGHDASFGWRRYAAKAHGLRYGGYHFIRPGQVLRQAHWFIQNMGDLTDMLLALDHEDPDVPLDNAQRFCEIVKQETGRYPVLYSGFLIKDQIARGDHSFWKQIRLWLAHYSAHPVWPESVWETLWLHQFTGDGDGPSPHGVIGITPYNKIDINSYQGTREQLDSEWAS